MNPFKNVVENEQALAAILGTPGRALGVERARHYRRTPPWVHSVLAAPPDVHRRFGWTLRCLSKGDAAGFALVRDEHRLVIPDRPGNKRLDGMRNLLTNPQLVPGREETLRVNGRAWALAIPRSSTGVPRRARRLRSPSALRSSRPSCVARRRFVGHISGTLISDPRRTRCHRSPAYCSIRFNQSESRYTKTSATSKTGT
jgi:hypothetical protein